MREPCGVSEREKSQRWVGGETCAVLKLQGCSFYNKYLPSSLYCHGTNRWPGDGRFLLLSSLVPNQNIRQPKHGHNGKSGFLLGVTYGSRMNPCTDSASVGYDLDCHIGNQIGQKKISGLRLWAISRGEAKNPNEPVFSKAPVGPSAPPPSLPRPFLQTLIGELLFVRPVLGTAASQSFLKWWCHYNLTQI